MARVTVEDCVVQIPNRFRLVMMAAQRSRELSVGGELTVERDNDKNPVVALREIADTTIDLEGLEGSLIQGLQKNVDVDEPIDEADEILAVEEALGTLAAVDSEGTAIENPFARGFEDEVDEGADADAELEAKDDAGDDPDAEADPPAAEEPDDSEK